MKKLYIFLAIAYILIAYCIVENMDAKMYMKEEAWKESTQALELEQQKIQLDILEVREQILKADEQIRAHNLLIWDIADKNYKTKLTDRQKASIKNAYNMLVTFRRIVEEKKMTDTYTSEEIDECYRELYDALLY